MRDFVLVCTPRSGSTVTGQVVRSHPAVGFAGEMLYTSPKAQRRWRRRLYRYLPIIPLLQRRATLRRDGVTSFGFKLFPAHVANSAGLVRLLQRFRFTVIGLERGSLFNQALSAALFVRPVGRRFDDPELQRELRRTEPITIDEQHFLTHLDSIHRQRTALRATLTAVSPDEYLVYERDVQSVESKPILAERLFRALELTPLPLDARLLAPPQSRSRLATNRERLQELTAAYAAEHAIGRFEPLR
jgi:hypothetical protein